MTTPAVNFGEVSAWIRAQAASKSIDEIREAVAARFETFFTLIRSLPEEQLREAAPGEDWLPLDALKHLAEWDWQAGEDILHVALTGERPNNPLPDFAGDREYLIARQKESLDSIYAHVSAADPEGFLDVKWEHPFFGLLNWREWYFFLGVHALDHTNQVKAMVSATDA